MAKKKKIVEEHKSEPVSKCDQLVKVDANGNHLDSGDIVLSQYDIEKLIITIRGKQVLIDRDLGKIYGVETKRLNEQVRRNIARFPDRYRFQLTKDEMQELLQLDKAGIKVAQYMTELPPREVLQRQIQKSLEIAKARFENLIEEE